MAAIPQHQIDALYSDVLHAYGSVSDDGTVVHNLAQAEYKERLAAFKSSVHKILQLNEYAEKSGLGAARPYYGITSNADWSPERFAGRMGGRLDNSTEIPVDPFPNQVFTEGTGPGTAFGEGLKKAMNAGGSGPHAEGTDSAFGIPKHDDLAGKASVPSGEGVAMDKCNRPSAVAAYCKAASPKAWAETAGCTWYAYYYGNQNAQAYARSTCEKDSRQTCYIVDINGNTCPSPTPAPAPRPVSPESFHECNNEGAVNTYCHSANPKAWVQTQGCGHWQYYYRDPNAVNDAKAACQKSTGKTCYVADENGNTCPKLPPPPPPSPPTPPAPPPPPAPGTCGIAPMNHVRNQGRCGSCWAFTTAEMMRYQYQHKYKQDPGVLSAQYLVDCAKGSVTHGCHGGNAAQAVTWMTTVGGIPTKEVYGPYLGKDGTCNLNEAKAVMPGPPYVTRSEEEMYKGYCAKGPFSIMINGDSIQHYSSGVMDAKSCPAKPIDHLVLVVGTTYYKGVRAWVIQNSWGPWYGATPEGAPNNGQNGGFILMKFGENTCGIQTAATFPADIFSQPGGPHPWTHTKPLLQWSKRWGPARGTHFSQKSTPIHKTKTGSMDECFAYAEKMADSFAIYAQDGGCQSTSGAWQVYSGSGASATLYQSGKPIGFANVEEVNQSPIMPMLVAFAGAAMVGSIVVFFAMRARRTISSTYASEPLL